MSFKKWIGIVGIALASTVLVACSEKQDDKNTLTIGVMTKTESDQARWDKVEELLKKDNITLKYKEFTDYSQPNKAVANGEVDINAFQHYNFLNNWNKEIRNIWWPLLIPISAQLTFSLEPVKMGRLNTNQ